MFNLQRTTSRSSRRKRSGPRRPRRPRRLRRLRLRPHRQSLRSPSPSLWQLRKTSGTGPLRYTSECSSSVAPSTKFLLGTVVATKRGRTTKSRSGRAIASSTSTLSQTIGGPARSQAGASGSSLVSGRHRWRERVYTDGLRSKLCGGAIFVDTGADLGSGLRERV